MTDEIKFAILGWLVGIISSLLLPEWINYREKSREKKSFIKILKLEIETLRIRLQSDFETFNTEHGLNKSKNAEIDLSYKLGNYLPIILGKPYNLNFYQENYKNLIYLSDTERNKIIDVFDRLSTMNSYIQIYHDILFEKDDKSIVDFKRKLVPYYFGHLKIVNEEINSIEGFDKSRYSNTRLQTIYKWIS